MKLRMNPIHRPKASASFQPCQRMLASGLAALQPLLLAASSARAGIIITTGNLTGTGTPYNGTDAPWGTSGLIVANTAPGTLTINGGSVVNNGVPNGSIANSAGASTSAMTVSGGGGGRQRRRTEDGRPRLSRADSASVLSQQPRTAVFREHPPKNHHFAADTALADCRT